MGVIITREDIMAYAEVDYIIHHMNERYLEMLPPKIVTFFEKMKDPEYEVYVDPRKPLQNQNLKKYTLEIIALLHLKYWCEDEERKQELYNRMETNQVKFEEKLRERFNADNIFDDTEEVETKEDLSKPKKIQVIENTAKEAENEEKEIDNELEEQNSNEIVTKEDVNIFKKIMIKIKGIFAKKNK